MRLSIKDLIQVSSYVGIDPTAPRMHLGNYLQMITNARGSMFGIDQIYLIGEATGRIGDPSGKRTERLAMQESTAEHNSREMRQKLELVLDNLYGYLNHQYGGSIVRIEMQSSLEYVFLGFL